MWQQFNNNPASRSVGDCAVRAVSIALQIPWERAYALMCLQGFAMSDMPSSNAVWGALLRQHGFERFALDNECPDCYTLEEFCIDHPLGTYVVGMSGHVATVVDGVIYDSWDSSNELPQYVWQRR